ncbi:MAG: hypothetical protein ABWK00_07055 [Desulfurococcaceae archaeon]
MWLLVLGYAALITTILWYRGPKEDQYRLGPLSLVLWSATLMFFVDSVFSYLSGEPFMEVSGDAVALGFSLLLAILVCWLAYLLLKGPRGILSGAGRR